MTTVMIWNIVRVLAVIGVFYLGGPWAGSLAIVASITLEYS